MKQLHTLLSATRAGFSGPVWTVSRENIATSIVGGPGSDFRAAQTGLKIRPAAYRHCVRGRRLYERGLLGTTAIVGVAFATSLSLARPAISAPKNGTVAAGNVRISSQGNVTRIVSSSNRSIINWQGFSLDANELANFKLPGAGSVVLNRVTGKDASVLLGAISSNGQVYLLNPNGVLIGGGAQIDTAGFVASTLNLGDADFLSGKDKHFSGTSAASITNLGTINIRGGSAYLIGAQVTNGGTINAPDGTAGLAAGLHVVLSLPPAPNSPPFVNPSPVVVLPVINLPSSFEDDAVVTHSNDLIFGHNSFPVAYGILYGADGVKPDGFVTQASSFDIAPDSFSTLNREVFLDLHNPATELQGYELRPETLAQDVLTKNVPTAGIAVVDDEISCTELKSVLDVINSRTAETNYRETCESGVRNASLHLRNPRFYRPVAR